MMRPNNLYIQIGFLVSVGFIFYYSNLPEATPIIESYQDISNVARLKQIEIENLKNLCLLAFLKLPVTTLTQIGNLQVHAVNLPAVNVLIQEGFGLADANFICHFFSMGNISYPGDLINLVSNIQMVWSGPRNRYTVFRTIL